MKRIALPILALLALAAPAARAQAPSYQPIRVDLTFYGAHASADATSWGGGVALEPKYNLTDHLALGFRFDAAAFITQDIKVASGAGETSISQGARAVTTVLAKADYYLTTTPVRPFVGLGLGLYRIGAGSQDVSGDSVVQTAQSFRGFGFCPQLGVNFGGFRLAGTYHVVTGGDMVVVAQAVGAPAPTVTKLSKNFFAFELGGTFGGSSRVGAVVQ
jgi:hypothetical protein